MRAVQKEEILSGADTMSSSPRKEGKVELVSQTSRKSRVSGMPHGGTSEQFITPDVYIFHISDNPQLGQ